MGWGSWKGQWVMGRGAGARTGKTTRQGAKAQRVEDREFLSLIVSLYLNGVFTVLLGRPLYNKNEKFHVFFEPVPFGPAMNERWAHIFHAEGQRFGDELPRSYSILTYIISKHGHFASVFLATLKDTAEEDLCQSGEAKRFASLFHILKRPQTVKMISTFCVTGSRVGYRLSGFPRMTRNRSIA